MNRKLSKLRKIIGDIGEYIKDIIIIQILLGFSYLNSTYGCDDLTNSLIRDLCKYTIYLHNVFGTGTLILSLLFGIIVFVSLRFPALLNFLNEILERFLNKIRGRNDNSIYRYNNDIDKKEFITLMKSEISKDIYKIEEFEKKIENILKELNKLSNELLTIKEKLQDTNDNTEDINEKIVIINKTIDLNSKLISELGKDIEVLKGSVNTLNSIITNLLMNINKLLIVLDDLDGIGKDIKKIKGLLNDLLE